MYIQRNIEIYPPIKNSKLSILRREDERDCIHTQGRYLCDRFSSTTKPRQILLIYVLLQKIFYKSI